MNPPIRPRRAAAAVLATLALSACSGGGEARTSAGRVEDRAARSAAELAKALDLTVPDGYVRQADNVDDTGPSNLDKAVADDGADDARDVFTRDRFVRGYQREWALNDHDQIVSYVYQFADAAGAGDYTTRIGAEAGAPASGGTIKTFSIPDIAGAVGVTTSDATFASSTVTFMKGPYSVQVVVNSTSPTGLQSLVTSVADEQYARL